MLILGIDPDVHRLAYAVWFNGRITAVQTIDRADSRRNIKVRYDCALTDLMRRASDRGAIIYLEDIFLAQGAKANVRGFKSMAEVQGEIKQAARKSQVPLVGVMATSWQSDILGLTRGREKLKEASLAHAAKVFPTPGRMLSDHEADAICIAEFGARTESARVA